jgi:hypothetical protein
MICEFRNNLERYICFSIGANPENHITMETYLSDVIITILFALITTLFIAWWIIPFRILFKILGKFNLKFVCKK